MSEGQKRISLVQQGGITEREYAKFAMMGSGGMIELYRPLTDEERRDYFLHIRNNPGVGLAM